MIQKFLDRAEEKEFNRYVGIVFEDLAKGIIEGLKEKSESVNRFDTTRKEHFGIIAKKMGEEVKESLRNDGYLVFVMVEAEKSCF